MNNNQNQVYNRSLVVGSIVLVTLALLIIIIYFARTYYLAS